MSEGKLLIQRIGLVSLANLLSSLGGVILLPILTKNMPASEYGIWAQVNVTVGLASVVIVLGLTNSMVRFMAAAKEKEEIQESFYSILLLVAFVGFFASLILFYLSGPLAAMLFDGNLAITRILPLLVFFESLNALLFNYFRTFQRMKLYSLFVFISMYLTIALAYYFVTAGWGIYGATVGLLLSKAVIFAILLIIILTQIGLRMPKFTMLREQLSFGLPLVPSGLSDWVMNSSDRYVISIFLGTAYVGYYSPGYILGNIILMFINSLGCVLPVVLTKHFDEDRMDAVEAVLGRTLKYFIALALPAVFGLSILSYPILSVLSTEEIASQGYLITPFVAVSMLFFGVASILANIIALVKRTDLSAKIWLLAAASNLGLCVMLVPRIGILGAALATLVAFAFVLGSTAYCALRLFKLSIDLRFILKCLLASLAMSLFLLSWSPVGLMQILSAIALSAGAYFLVLWLLKGIDGEAVQFMKNMLKKGA